MEYKVFYHKSVLAEDFKKIPHVDIKKIGRAVKKKLRTEPVLFGKVLRADLKGYYRLRVGIYRVVYRIDHGKVIVYVIKVGLRRDSKVYIEAAKRLKLL